MFTIKIQILAIVFVNEFILLFWLNVKISISTSVLQYDAIRHVYEGLELQVIENSQIFAQKMHSKNVKSKL